MADEVAPVQPAPEVWTRIERSLGGSGNVVSFTPRPTPWDRVSVWRAATAASLAAAAVLAFIAIRPPTAPPPLARAAPPLLTATLASTDGKSLYVATIDKSRRQVTVIPVSAIESGGRTPELWIIPVGGKPHGLWAWSLGRKAQMVPAASTVLSAAEARSILAGRLLEPPGGSPTGAPTGPVIASGIVKSLDESID